MEHYKVENDVLNDTTMINALRECRLLNFFRCHNLRSQLQFLQMLIKYCDLDYDALMLENKILKLEVEDI
jgi:hypothetical protein